MKRVMSSWVSKTEERVASLVSDFIRPYKATIQQKHYVELHDILMDTGKQIACEMEKLKVDKELIKDECVLLEGMKAKAESEKAKYQTELRKCVKECQELKERLARSRNDNLVSELRRKIDRLESLLYERDDWIRDHWQRVSVSEKKVADIENELKVLKDQKLASDGILEEMRVKEIEANRAMDELRRRNLELSQNVKELRCQKLESSDTVRGYRQKLLSSEKKVVDMQKEVKDLKDQKLTLDGIMDGMRRKEIEANHKVKELRRTYVKKAFEIEKEFRCEMLAAETRYEEIVQEMKQKEFEAHQTAEEKTGYETIIEEMKRKEFEAEQTADDLRSRNLKAHDDIVDLRNRILDLEKDKMKFEQTISELRSKQMDDDQALDKLTHEHLEAIEDLKRKIVKKSKETKEAKDGNTSFCNGEKQNLECGSSISTERASTVLQQIETTDSPDEAIPGSATSNSDLHHVLNKMTCSADDADAIVSLDESIPGAATSNSDLRPNLGEQEKIPSCPSSLQSGLQDIPVLKRKRSPRANGDDNSRQSKKQVPIPTHKRVVVLALRAGTSENPNSGFARKRSSSTSKLVTHERDVSLPADISGDPDSGFARNKSSSNSKPVTHKGDVSLPADISGNSDSGFVRNESSSKSKPVTHERDVSLPADIPGNPNSGFAGNRSSSEGKPVTVCDSQSQLFKSCSSSSESSSDSGYSDSRMDEMVREVREKIRKA